MLTGPAATQALQLYSRLGATGASFNARKVARDIRTPSGRMRIAFALVSKIGRAGMVIRFSRPRPRAFRARRSGSVRNRSRGSGRPQHHLDATVRLGTFSACQSGVWDG